MVRDDDCHAGTPTGTPGSNPPRHIRVFFFLKIQETCTLTTFVEQKLSLCVKKLGNFIRVYVNWERAISDMETIFVWAESSVTCNQRICLCLRKKYLDLSNDYKFTYVKRVFWRALKLSFNFFSPENSIIASGEVNTTLHLSPSACSMARRNTFIAHWIFPSKVNRNKNSRLQNLLFRTRNENTAQLWIISAVVASNWS